MTAAFKGILVGFVAGASFVFIVIIPIILYGECAARLLTGCSADEKLIGLQRLMKEIEK